MKPVLALRRVLRHDRRKVQQRELALERPREMVFWDLRRDTSPDEVQLLADIWLEALPRCLVEALLSNRLRRACELQVGHHEEISRRATNAPASGRSKF